MSRGHSPRAPFHTDGFTEEFLAMTFIHGPEEASFLNEPAKLRFFVGYADEFTPGDGSDRVRMGSYASFVQFVSSYPARVIINLAFSLWLLAVATFCAACAPEGPHLARTAEGICSRTNSA